MRIIWPNKTFKNSLATSFASHKKNPDWPKRVLCVPIVGLDAQKWETSGYCLQLQVYRWWVQTMHSLEVSAIFISNKICVTVTSSYFAIKNYKTAGLRHQTITKKAFNHKITKSNEDTRVPSVKMWLFESIDFMFTHSPCSEMKDINTSWCLAIFLYCANINLICAVSKFKNSFNLIRNYRIFFFSQEYDTLTCTSI